MRTQLTSESEVDRARNCDTAYEPASVPCLTSSTSGLLGHTSSWYLIPWRTLLVFLPARCTGEAVRKYGLNIVLRSANIAAMPLPHRHRAHHCAELVLETRYPRRC